MATVPSLTSICQAKVFQVLEETNFNTKLINEICKYVPNDLLDPIFEMLLERRAVTDVALVAFLVPSRYSLKINQALNIRNSVFKQIGVNCPFLIKLDLSDCSQVSNSVVRAVFQGCRMLEEVTLDRCFRITDAAFDINQSPFQMLVGCLSIKSLSLQGCPQITGDIIGTLNKNCRSLVNLNLSQCKNVRSPQLQHIFQHNALESLNLAFIEDLSDETFRLLPGITNSCASIEDAGGSPLQSLNLCKSKITDASIFKMAYLIALTEIHLQWCNGITDTGITALVRNCPKLSLIDLMSCSITDESLTSIAELCSELKQLDLSWCLGFTIRGLQQLARRWGRAHQLEKLSLVWCQQVDDAGMEELSYIQSLQTIDVTGCSEVTKAGIDYAESKGISVVL